MSSDGGRSTEARRSSSRRISWPSRCTAASRCAAACRSRRRASSATAGFAWDLYAAKVASIYASLDWFASKRVTASLDYDFYQPTYDADSIWNLFAGYPMNDIALRGNWDITDSTSVAAQVHARLFT